MGLAGIAMAGIQPGRVDMIPKPSELPLPSTPCFEVGVDFDEGLHTGYITNGLEFTTVTAMDCWSMCKLERSCMGFVWMKPTTLAKVGKYGCWLKKATFGKAFPQKRKDNDHVVSGLRDCLY